MSDATTQAWHAHLDGCEQCRDQPFNLCARGAKLLAWAATAVAARSPLHRDAE